ncbi:MAG TPA: hypothetical protein VK209_03835 [Candidatus Sulfotelmatobacter sp.]|nr:hypothetical protein [Candidatus Sulfotelmatobacter sp.]
MSEEDTFWISLGQRFFGLLLLIIGIIMIYFTVTSIAELAAFSFFFGFLSVVLLVIGIALLIARSPE